MSIDGAINRIIGDSTGNRVGDRNFLPTKKEELFAEDIKTALIEQWSSSGRDAARIFAKLDEADGTSIFLTGFDGENKFVGHDFSGFGYIPAARIKGAKFDESWDNNLTLGHIRQNLDEMDKAQVTDLLSRLRKCLTKRSKSRRQSEVKNFVKRFQKACAADRAKEEKEVKTEQKNDDKKKPDKKGEYSWHTKGNRTVPMKEDAFSRFKKLTQEAESFKDKMDRESGYFGKLKTAQKLPRGLAMDILEKPQDRHRGPMPSKVTFKSGKGAAKTTTRSARKLRSLRYLD